eukprot:5780028-Amphidinium_carterae.1
MRWFSWVLTAPIRKEESISRYARSDLFRGGQFLRKLNPQPEGLDTGRNFLQEILYLSFFALLCKDWALKNYMMRSAKTFLAERTGGVLIEGPGSTVVHP